MWGAATDLGRVRSLNEDSYLAQPPIFLVADGMGGYAAGDEASAMVVEEFMARSPGEVVTPEWVVSALERANSRVLAGSGGGTTVAGAAAIEQNGADYWMVFNIGDSRVYHLSDGELAQVSVDHSVVQELVDEGSLDAEAARLHPQRHMITRAIGAPDTFAPDYWLLPASAGDRLMLCSDGITSEMDAVQIDRLIRSSGSPQDVADRLVAGALEHGGHDNVTVVVVDVTGVVGEPVLGASGRHTADDGHEPIDDRTLPRRAEPSESGSSR